MSGTPTRPLPPYGEMSFESELIGLNVTFIVNVITLNLNSSYSRMRLIFDIMIYLLFFTFCWVCLSYSAVCGQAIITRLSICKFTC